MDIQQNTDYLRLFYFGATHTGDISLAVKYSKNGAAFIDPPAGGGGSWDLTEIGRGWYFFQLLTANGDTDTLGPLAYSFTSATIPIDPVLDPALDSIVSYNLAYLDAPVSSRGTANPGDQMDLLAGTIAAIQAGLLNLGTAFDGTATLGQLLQVMAAVLAGKEATTAGVTEFWNWALTKVRVQTQATAGGNRTTPVFDFS